MKYVIDEILLRKYIFHNQLLMEHMDGVAVTYLEGAYDNEDELESDMEYVLKRIKKLKEFENEILVELEKQSS